MSAPAPRPTRTAEEIAIDLYRVFWDSRPHYEWDATPYELDREAWRRVSLRVLALFEAAQPRMPVRECERFSAGIVDRVQEGTGRESIFAGDDGRRAHIRRELEQFIDERCAELIRYARAQGGANEAREGEK